MSALPPEPGRGPLRRDDLDVTLGVRRELGPEYDEAVIAEFLNRVGRAIDERVDARLAERRSESGEQARRPPITLAIVSIVGGFLMSSVVLGTTQGSVAGVFLVVVAWVAIAALNVAHARER